MLGHVADSLLKFKGELAPGTLPNQSSMAQLLDTLERSYTLAEERAPAGAAPANNSDITFF
jgi:hypothetical protein